MLRFFSNKPRWLASPNFNTRGEQKVHYIILHYTDTADTNEALSFLRDRERQVSAHYVVEKNGRIIQMVKDQYRAWHAGKSYWRGESDMNAASIGIEIVNGGARCGYELFPDKQMKAVATLCHNAMKNHDIPSQNVLAHSDIAPARKIDPDYLFPWRGLAEQGIGAFPEPNEHDYQTAQDVFLRDGEFDALLVQYGYDPTVTAEQRTLAFHRHFYPEKFLSGNPAEVDVSSVARILSLLSK